ncbi:MAG: Cell wall anchor protein [Chloroflexi bacterium]|nr:Cell wall anchor protein [Chloroflexota bacterium]
MREDHDYFVAAPPRALLIDATQLRRLEVRRPFFIDHGWSFGPDRDLVPFVWDDRVGGEPRFSEAEALTDYDSGSLGLAAMSAPTAESQVQLYRVLGQAIIQVHQNNRDLLAEWFDAQGASSADAFVYFDRQRPSAQEKLLAPDGTVDRVVWDARLDELTACLTVGSVHKHHFRWVEFLAHSVNIPELMRLIQAAA